MHRVRIPSFVFLIISDLHAANMYILRRRDVHAGKTPSIPVAPGPIPVAGSPLFVAQKALSARRRTRVSR